MVFGVFILFALVVSFVYGLESSWLQVDVSAFPFGHLVGRPLNHLSLFNFLYINFRGPVVRTNLKLLINLWRRLLNLVTPGIVLELFFVLLDLFVDLELASLPMHVVLLVELVDLVWDQVLGVGLYGFLLLELNIVPL